MIVVKFPYNDTVYWLEDEHRGQLDVSLRPRRLPVKVKQEKVKQELNVSMKPQAYNWFDEVKDEGSQV